MRKRRLLLYLVRDCTLSTRVIPTMCYTFFIVWCNMHYVYVCTLGKV